jgi:hypothetical protein
VPVIVTVEDPAGVLEVVVTVSVEVPGPVNEVGLHAPVVPAGNPLTLSPTVPVNPFNAPTFTVYVVPPPTVTVCEEGVVEIVKSGLPVTFKETVAVWVSESLVPVIVSVEPPTGVLEAVVTVRVELAPGPIADGLNEAVAPVGNPLMFSPTLPLNEFTAATLTVYVVVLPPTTTLCEEGVAVIVKSLPRGIISIPLDLG